MGRQQVDVFTKDDLNQIALDIEESIKQLKLSHPRTEVRVSSMTLTNVFVPRGHPDAGLTFSALVCFDIG
ncbi:MULTISPECIES: hypothetical protein [unclassified Amycolatopsis]|uniref:hypothetical protein n=1 Tax=unclassified Amycolatopsis TaxID=2618356 RepID=UPI002E213099|nr:MULTISPECIES: hypothetical protein [unclassified Amycolatopsis]